MTDEPPRSSGARAAAEAALVRVVHHYGSRPEFVVLGGLVPELLRADSAYRHAGTTDVDVQVDLEIACGSVHTRRLEVALRNAEFEPDADRVWRWVADDTTSRAVIKFELLADFDDQPAPATFAFDECEHLGAANLRGTGFAARDIAVQELRASVGDVNHVVEVNVAGLAGFLLAKTAAALVLDTFGSELVGSIRTALDDLHANFADPLAQGPQAYAAQMLVDHPELDEAALLADAVTAIDEFHRALSAPRTTNP